ncbi:MAG: NAD(P)/FAD-dependent oxidoreductase [Proteobacteria bacterium]|nr:NAD(P)/FAD-dependent oxidoreductase [Pseudomonadota bacterium]
MDRIECVVIGAGVIGLSIARALALEGKEVLIIEAEDTFGMHTSSRNSEVIHAGIYYPKDSLKATLCVSGKKLLYEYCELRDIPFKRIGKLIVATDDSEIETVKQYISKAAENGVNDLTWLNQKEALELEPEIRCVGAVFSPSTGIIDSHAYMLSLLGDAENAGGIVAYHTSIESIASDKHGFILKTGGSNAHEIHTKLLINAAGLRACDVANSMTGLDKTLVPISYYAKAHYYSLSMRSPFKHLIYPIARKHGLGVHVTVDMGGNARFGPDIDWIPNIDYTFDNSREALFYDAIRRYWPTANQKQLQPGYTGIRPKISGPGEPAADFMIQSEKDHGLRGLVNLFGIESPGLTSSLAIAELVKKLLSRNTS